MRDVVALIVRKQVGRKRSRDGKIVVVAAIDDIKTKPPSAVVHTLNKRY